MRSNSIFVFVVRRIKEHRVVRISNFGATKRKSLENEARAWNATVKLLNLLRREKKIIKMWRVCARDGRLNNSWVADTLFTAMSCWNDSENSISKGHTSYRKHLFNKALSGTCFAKKKK